jgi:hypothetical protein
MVTMFVGAMVIRRRRAAAGYTILPVSEVRTSPTHPTLLLLPPAMDPLSVLLDKVLADVPRSVTLMIPT